MGMWNNESQSEQYFRALNNKRNWGHSDPIIGIVKTCGPIILFFAVISFIIKNLMYIVSIGVIVIACVLICKNLQRRARNPGAKIFLTIIVSIVLVIGVFFAVPVIQNGSLRAIPVSRNQTVPDQARFMLVGSDALNVRKGPSANNDVMGQLKKGDRVQVLNSSGQWWRIKSGNIEGYVNSQYLIEEKAPSAPVSLLSLPARPRMGTTRDWDFQNDYENAIKEYDARMRGVPGSLILPGGQTVDEAVRSGTTSGK